MLVSLPHGHRADVVADAISQRITALPEQLRRSLTWGRGKEMADHARFSIDTGVAAYFCGPRSPWQRGTNENTNGLLRQYFPKRSDLALHSQADLDAVAAELNGRPRQTVQPSTQSARLQWRRCGRADPQTLAVKALVTLSRTRTFTLGWNE
jgi:IS30 family transposase